jgi:phosphohistidine swiveling domain-containing protein
MMRRLATAWRVGRLRVAMPNLVEGIVAAVDRDLGTIPRLDALGSDELLDLIERARRELATVHTYEVLAGMLMTRQDGPSGVALALQALHDGRAVGWSDEQIISGSPMVLSLTAPRLGTDIRLPPTTPPGSSQVQPVEQLDQRESLRVRVRWLQELLARAADELGFRLGTEGAIADAEWIAHLHLSELLAMAGGGPPPSNLSERVTRQPGPPLPVSFRLTTHGEARPASVSSHARRPNAAGGLPAGGGRAVGLVHHRLDESPIPDGVILVTRHLEPQLATDLGRLVGLVSETGSALSHLAILARESHVPTVVGVPDAMERYPQGTRLMIDGRTGEIDVVDPASDLPAGTAMVQ